MTWDLRLDPATRDLTAGYVGGADEILQRLVTRLKRELGEWFLNTDAGLPWYQNGKGLLGSRNKFVLDMLIRRETRNTDGVERILQMNTIFSGRSYSVAMRLLLVGDVSASFNLTEESGTWRIAA